MNNILIFIPTYNERNNIDEIFTNVRLAGTLGNTAGIMQKINKMTNIQ